MRERRMERGIPRSGKACVRPHAFWLAGIGFGALLGCTPAVGPAPKASAGEAGSVAPEELEHFSMDGYPFGGHHASEVGSVVREALGAAGKPAVMPKDHPGAVMGDDLALVLVWADAFDHHHGGGHAHHDDDDVSA